MIICAAVKIQNYYSDKENKDLIICGHRHGDCYEIIHNLMPKNVNSQYIEGFIEHNNCFLDREQAFLHAVSCGQLSTTTRWYKEDRSDRELYSEDLY